VSSLFAGRDVIVALIGGRGGGKRERGGVCGHTKDTISIFWLVLLYLLFIVIASQMFRAECKRKTKASKYREQSKANICK